MICVTGYRIDHGSAALFGLKPSKNPNRRYTLRAVVEMTIFTDEGELHCKTEPGFIFDGRSGPAVIDYYVPNLGSLDERAAWWMHDVLGYAQSLDFKRTNQILRFFLRDICGYRASKAWTIEKAVSISSKWFGEPVPPDWCVCNIGFVKSWWISK